MSRPWLSLTDAADELEVAPRTVRRWVQAGKLPAELRPGSHGMQYYLPTDAVRELQTVRDVEQPGRRVEIDRVVELVSGYLEARERTFQEEQDRLRDELRMVRGQLQQAFADLTRAQQALWQQCQDLAQTQRTMQRLGDDLTATRARARGTRDERRKHQAEVLDAGDEDTA